MNSLIPGPIIKSVVAIHRINAASRGHSLRTSDDNAMNISRQEALRTSTESADNAKKQAAIAARTGAKTAAQTGAAAGSGGASEIAKGSNRGSEKICRYIKGCMHHSLNQSPTDYRDGAFIRYCNI